MTITEEPPIPGPGQPGRSGQPGIFSRLYNGETDIDFIGRRRLWAILSLVVIAAGLLSLGIRGLNLGIDFEGGTSWELPVESDVSVDEVREAVAEAGLDEAEVQTLGGEAGDRVRVQAEPSDDTDERAVSEALAEVAGLDDVDEVTVNSVSASWGDDITEKARNALVVFLIVITLYITLRFELKMALATLLALVHDILVTVGVYSLFHFPVTPATVIAVLTILGYSIYDGIVVFDKVDENAKLLVAGGRGSYGGMVNSSLNQVLMRTLNTSITALLPILSLLIVGSLVLGADTLQEFALALFIGLGSGAYSSIFIASPALAWLKEREPRWAARKGEGQPTAKPTIGPSPGAGASQGTPATSAGEGGAQVATAARRPTGPPIGGVVTPRPRKKPKPRRR
jgi:preprotein translocase subunit SecF